MRASASEAVAALYRGVDTSQRVRGLVAVSGDLHQDIVDQVHGSSADDRRDHLVDQRYEPERSSGSRSNWWLNERG